MAVNWTKNQKRIIEFQKGSILVAAGAGSGKTAVLTEHIVSKITDEENPIDLDQLLVVTFTNAAAAEMKERIRNKLEARLLMQPENENLLRQIGLVSSADISTIHSFCLKIIREQFFRLNLDPGFRLGDTGELSLMKDDILDEMFEEQYEQMESSFLQFRDIYGKGMDDDAIKKLILKLYEYANSYPEPEEWINNALNDELSWTEMLKDYLLTKVHSLSKRIKGLIFEAEELGLPEKYIDALKNDEASLKAVCDKDTLFSVAEAISEISFTRKPTVSKKEKSEIARIEELVKGIFDSRDEIKKGVSDLNKSFAGISNERLEYERSETSPMNREMMRLLRLFSERFSQKKQSLCICDFSDLEHMALKVLYEEGTPTDAADTYANSYKEILIDEYQDCNLIQEHILLAVSRKRFGEDNRFMVGDVKQSIYGFRQARPELFLEKYRSYDDSEQSMTQKVELSSNFRSREGVLEGINIIFRQIMTEKLGGIEYDDKTCLHPGAAFPSRDDDISDIDVCLLEKKSEADDEVNKKISEYNKFELEARMIGEKIQEMVLSDSPFPVKDTSSEGLRPARYSDIVILMRSLYGKQEDYLRIFREMGIPVCTESEGGYFTSPEISNLLDYLRVIDNPIQDIPLAAVLRSPFGCFCANELAKIRIIGKGAGRAESFYSCCMAARKSMPKLDRFMFGMEQYRRLSKLVPIHDFITRIIEESGFKYYVCALPDGNKRIRNLEMLIAKAKNYEETSYRGLFHFIRYIDRLRRYNSDNDIGQEYNEEINAVRIMTIHKSKGLEFPIVFLANTSGEFNKKDLNAAVLPDSQFGLATDIKNAKYRYSIRTVKKAFIRQKQSISMLEEEMRVLYVALTRAKEKLIITAYSEDLTKELDKWGAGSSASISPFDFDQLTNVSCFIDWIMPAFISAQRSVNENLSPISLQDSCSKFTVDGCSIKLIRVDADELFESYDYKTAELDNGEDVLPDKIKNILDWTYPHDELTRLHAVMSVSELKKKLYLSDGAEPQIKDIKSYSEDASSLTGADRGTAYHRVLELLSFDNYPEEGSAGEKKDYINRSVERMVEEGLLKREEADAVRFNDILVFFDNTLGRRMISASRANALHKEQPFLLGIEAGRFIGDKSDSKMDVGEPMVLIRGIIDCYFVEDQGIVLVDYKTDRVNKSGGDKTLIERYRIQLDYYKKALWKAYHIPVSEVYIYSFALGREIMVCDV